MSVLAITRHIPTGVGLPSASVGQSFLTPISTDGLACQNFGKEGPSLPNFGKEGRVAPWKRSFFSHLPIKTLDSNSVSNSELSLS